MDLTVDNLILWLSLCQESTRKKLSLLQNMNIREVYDSIENNLLVKNYLSEKGITQLIELKKSNSVDKMLDIMNKSGIKYITINDSKYPERLNQPSVIPPIILFYIGNIDLLSTTCISIVGTRNCTRYGKEVAEKLATDLCEYSLTVVSGMATGIDGYAQQAAIDCNGYTIGVIGSGLNKPTPTSNFGLFKSICEKGLMISEYAPDATATKYSFPERNRIIAALGQATIVVEAASKSGALITADMAFEQNKEVFAVPGSIFSPHSTGTNDLLKDKARPITSVKDILSYLNISNINIVKNNKDIALDIYEEKIYTLLKNEPLNIEQLKDLTDFSVKELLILLFSLEMKEAITRQHNNTYKVERIKIETSNN